MDYPGKVITKTQVTPTQTSASGNWTLDDQAAAIKNNNWPVALVPNPISKSLRFNSADTAYLNRTPASAGNRKTWTWSAWVKRSVLGTPDQVLFSAYTDGNNEMFIRLNDTNALYIYNYQSASLQVSLTTTALYRDTSAWYHVIVALDTTQATSTDRVKIYVNGIQVTSFSTTTYPSLNLDCHINAAVAHNLGRRGSAVNYLNGYMTEVNFIDGQALTPSSFGMTNPQTGQWIPLKYSGTYGTNGFYVNFKDATSTTTLGYDYSGNANNWTSNGFVVSPVTSVGNDSVTDVPTPWFAYNTTGDVGGVIRGNYATLNPLITTTTLSNGNLQCVTTASPYGRAHSTIGVSSGKWYAEVVLTSGVSNTLIGITNAPVASNASGALGYLATEWSYFSDGRKYNNNTLSSYGASYTTNDVIGVALDLDNKTITFYKNGTSQGTAFSSLADGTYFISIGGAVVLTLAINFGQRPFAYTPPTGFRSLCSTNLPATDIGFGLTNQANKYMNVVTYTGTGSSLGVTGVGFQPDLVWIKSRSATTDHGLYDAVRGVQNQLESNTTTAETVEATGLTAFGSDGFTVGALAQLNTSSATYVGWNWKASNATAVTNTAGTITSTVSANTTAGFSIVTYTGNGSTGTIGHGLNFAPDMVIVKGRNTINLDWVVYHKSLTSAAYALFLNATNIQTLGPTYWNSTAPTNTVFSVGADNNTNKSATTYVAYCFDTVPGYSAFDSYTANNAVDGVFVYLGFRPEWLMIKRATTTAGNSWVILDSARNTFNVTNNALYPNQTYAENGTIGAMPIDFLSNGFKIRTDSSEVNGTGTYIYAAFAESPFQFANAR
jgi:hypothetical protein